MTVAKIQRSLPLRDQVFEGVMQALKVGTFLPGDRLTEERVGSVLGVSRTPVREALSLLAQRGILSRRNGGGFIVASPGTKSLQDIFELRRRLEPYALRRAAELVTQVQLKELASNIKILRELVNQAKPVEFMHANSEVRRLLFSFAGNDALAGAIGQLNDHVHFIGMLTMKDIAVRKLVLALHKKIFAALAAKDADAAEEAMLEYLDAASRTLLAALPVPEQREDLGERHAPLSQKSDLAPSGPIDRRKSRKRLATFNRTHN